MADVNVRVTCPECGYIAAEAMPMDRCMFFWECVACHAVVKPKDGDCCVFCSYGDKRCPFMQDGTDCPGCSA